MAALCLDLDRFKAVNDTLGHAAGDLLLRQGAARLREVVRGSDTVARMGGDEFVILQANGPQPQAASALAEREVRALCAPFDLDSQGARIGTSVGVAVYQRDGACAEEMLKNADLALHRAKSQGRGASCSYDPSMDAKSRGRRLLEQDLHAALGAGQLELHYQPLVDSRRGGGVTGFEALMRWSHPARGSVSPADLIPLAEEPGPIMPLGRWALETACREAVDWPGAPRVAVNFSPAQFRNDDLPATVAGALRRAGLPAGRLELEITENLLIGDTAQALAALRGLKALGVRIALDDFGTGYFSLSYLHRFPFDRIKIDRSFVKALDEDPGGRAIVGAILAMGRALDLDVTAEGVETARQLAALKAQSCGTVQGYLLGRPMRAEAVAGLLRDGQGRRDAAGDAPPAPRASAKRPGRCAPRAAPARQRTQPSTFGDGEGEGEGGDVVARAPVEARGHAAPVPRRGTAMGTGRKRAGRVGWTAPNISYARRRHRPVAIRLAP